MIAVYFDNAAFVDSDDLSVCDRLRFAVCSFLGDTRRRCRSVNRIAKQTTLRLLLLPLLLSQLPEITRHFVFRLKRLHRALGRNWPGGGDGWDRVDRDCGADQ